MAVYRQSVRLGSKPLADHDQTTEVEVEFTLRPTVSRPVSLGVKRPSGTRDQFFFLLEIFFRQLRVCNFVAPSLTRRRVCNLLYNCFWALAQQSLLRRSPAELTAIFYCLIWDSPNLEGQVPVFISPRNRVSSFPPGTGFPFCRLLRLAGLRWRYSNPPPHGSSQPPACSHYITSSRTTQKTPCCLAMAQQFLSCCVNIRSRGEVSAVPMSRNLLGLLFRLPSVMSQIYM
jgi:hypothetical protein